MNEEAGKTEWSYEDTLNYECAREAISHMVSIYSSIIHTEEKKPHPDKKILALLHTGISHLSDEVRNLRMDNRAEVARVRSQYCKIIHEYESREEEIEAESQAVSS
ncbi:MAG: hypothetical protein LBF50_04680 [Azoarcus sp.]|jgi:radical SAM superfamily enzyme with C-terminal helix-hairpin-helix motif|nr:hypothetical protein [Azoarcus sp.]